MEGKRILNSLPEALKDKISAKYGDIDIFYDNVFNASAEAYIAVAVKKDKDKENELDEYRFKTAIELEAMAQSVGLNDIDGFDIYDAISGDFDETLIKINYRSKPTR